MNKNFKIFTLPEGPLETNMHLIAAGTSCVAVDVPPNAAGTLGKFLEENSLKLEAILLTHGHWDHNGGIAEALEKFGNVPVFAHEEGREFCENPEKFAAFYQIGNPGISDDEFRAFKLTREAQDGENFGLLGKIWTAFFVPGHCPGSLAFYCEDEKIVFTGDVLFAGSVGRSDFPGGNFRVLENSIREKLYVLPGETKVFPGHGAGTTIARERYSNPFVRG